MATFACLAGGVRDQLCVPSVGAMQSRAFDVGAGGGGGAAAGGSSERHHAEKTACGHTRCGGERHTSAGVQLG